jgi:hypothetical protein
MTEILKVIYTMLTGVSGTLYAYIADRVFYGVAPLDTIAVPTSLTTAKYPYIVYRDIIGNQTFDTTGTSDILTIQIDIYDSSESFTNLIAMEEAVKTLFNYKTANLTITNYNFLSIMLEYSTHFTEIDGTLRSILRFRIESERR